MREPDTATRILVPLALKVFSKGYSGTLSQDNLWPKIRRSSSILVSYVFHFLKVSAVHEDSAIIISGFIGTRMSRNPLVETRGFEPLTSAVQRRRSSN